MKTFSTPRKLAAAVLVGLLTLSTCGAAAAPSTALNIQQAVQAAASEASAKVKAPVIQAAQADDGRVRLKRVQDASSSVPGAKLIGYQLVAEESDPFEGLSYRFGELFEVKSSIPSYCLPEWSYQNRTVSLRASYELPSGEIIHADSAAVSCYTSDPVPESWGTEMGESAQITAAKVSAEYFNANTGVRLKRSQDAKSSIPGSTFLGYAVMTEAGADVTHHYSPRSDLLQPSGTNAKGTFPTWSHLEPAANGRFGLLKLRAAFRAPDGSVQYKDSALFDTTAPAGAPEKPSTEPVVLPEASSARTTGNTVDWADSTSIGASLLDRAPAWFSTSVHTIGWRDSPRNQIAEYAQISAYLTADGERLKPGKTERPSYDDGLYEDFYTVERAEKDTTIVAAIRVDEQGNEYIQPLDEFVVPALRTGEIKPLAKLKVIPMPGSRQVRLVFEDPANDYLISGHGGVASGEGNRGVQRLPGMANGDLMGGMHEGRPAFTYVASYSKAEEIPEDASLEFWASWAGSDLAKITIMGLALSGTPTERPEQASLVGHLTPLELIYPSVSEDLPWTPLEPSEPVPGIPLTPLDPADPKPDTPLTPLDPSKPKPGTPLTPAKPKPGVPWTPMIPADKPTTKPEPPVVKPPTPEDPPTTPVKPKPEKPSTKPDSERPEPKPVGDKPTKPKPQDTPKKDPIWKPKDRQDQPKVGDRVGDPPTSKRVPPRQPKHNKKPEVMSTLVPGALAEIQAKR